MADVKVRALKNGPYEVTGAIELLDFEKQAYATEEGPIYLCRCGQSQNRPFCDGTHKAAGFKSEECVRLRKA